MTAGPTPVHLFGRGEQSMEDVVMLWKEIYDKLRVRAVDEPAQSTEDL